jgi:hypothetical protein
LMAAYHPNNKSPLLKLFLAQLPDLAARVAKKTGVKNSH